MRVVKSIGLPMRAAGCITCRLPTAPPGGDAARPAARAVASAATASPSQPCPARYAVIGGGFAGVATAWHLLSHARPEHPVQLHLYDAFGLGAGGSGAAAGLLHPYSPRGKLLWQGLEAFQDAVRLAEAAEAAAAADAAAQDSSPQAPFTWRHGILRPARSLKQARDLAKFAPADPMAQAATGAVLMDAAKLAQLVPGLRPERLLAVPEAAATAVGQLVVQASSRGSGGQQQQQVSQAEVATAAGLLVGQAVVLNPARYLHALWAGCQQLAQRSGGGSAAELRQRPVSSLAQLDQQEGGYDGIVVAAGAAVGTIQETAGLLPMELCQGYTLHMRPGRTASGSTGSSNGNRAGAHGACGGGRDEPEGSESSSGSSGGSVSSSSSGGIGGGGGGYPPGAPSLLGSTYISAHGTKNLVVGATKRYGLSAAEAYSQCSQPAVTDAAVAHAAVEALLPPAAELWPPVAGWEVAAVVSGVRALPTRGRDGSIPYIGRIPARWAAEGLEEQQAQQQPGERPWWLVGGLGARGLVYHAWLGRLVAEALLADSEDGLPPELLRWQQP